MMQAEEIVLKANSTGTFKYFCSVRGHAKGGMWGNIAVGVKPDDKMKMPTKSSNGDMKDMPGMKPGETMNMPVKKPSGEAPMEPGMTNDQMKTMPSINMEMSSLTIIGDPLERESSGS